MTCIEIASIHKPSTLGGSLTGRLLLSLGGVTDLDLDLEYDLERDLEYDFDLDLDRLYLLRFFFL